MRISAASAQHYARFAGILILISIVAGAYGEFYIPSQNLTADAPSFRLGFAAYQVEAACDVALTLILYVLLRSVDANVALGAAFFRLLGTATYATGEIGYFAGSEKALVAGGDLSIMFYGIGTGVLGILMFRSGYLPKWLGALVAIGGLGFIARSFAVLLLDGYPTTWLVLPMVIALLALALWLLIAGVSTRAWEARSTAQR
jgi:hypothetical protein